MNRAVWRRQGNQLLRLVSVRRASCDGIGTLAQLGWEWRFVGWPGHTTVEAKYDGRWHYLDVFLKFYAWMPDQKIRASASSPAKTIWPPTPQGLITDAFVLDKARAVVYAKTDQYRMIGDKANWQARVPGVRRYVAGCDRGHQAPQPRRQSRWLGTDQARDRQLFCRREPCAVLR